MKNTELVRLIGKKIAYLRKKKKLSQEQLAEAINKTPNAISNIERGINTAKLYTYFDIAKVLDVDIGDLFKVHDKKSNNSTINNKIDKVVELLLSANEEQFDKAIKILELSL